MKKFFEALDSHGYEFKLNFEERTVYKTAVGGVVTSLKVLLIISYLVYEGKLWFEMKQDRVTRVSSLVSDTTKYVTPKEYSSLFFISISNFEHLAEPFNYFLRDETYKKIL